MPEGTGNPGSGWRERALSNNTRPPVLDQAAVRAHNQDMYKEVTLLQLLPADGRNLDEVRRAAAGAARYSERVTRAIVRGYGGMGEPAKVQEVQRQQGELELTLDTQDNHNTLWTRASYTIMARKEDLHREVGPLVVELQQRAEAEPGNPKVQDAWNQVRRALEEDEKDKKDSSKLREQGRAEGLAALQERDEQLADLRLHLQQKEKQVEFLLNRVNELESGVLGGGAKDKGRGATR